MSKNKSLDKKKAKDFLRVDFDEEDELIESLISASDNYLQNAGAKKDAGEKLYELGQLILISHWYDNREAIGKADKLAFSLQSILFQLKWAGESDESG